MALLVDSSDVLIVNSDVDEENSVNVGRERVEVKLSDVFDFEDDIGGEIETLGLVVVSFLVRLVDVLLQLLVFRRVHCLGWDPHPLLHEPLFLPKGVFTLCLPAR